MRLKTSKTNKWETNRTVQWIPINKSDKPITFSAYHIFSASLQRVFRTWNMLDANLGDSYYIFYIETTGGIPENNYGLARVERMSVFLVLSMDGDPGFQIGNANELY